MATPVKQSSILQSVIKWICGLFASSNPFTRDAIIPQNMILSTSALLRYNYSAYPIFSLHENDFEFIDQYREVALQLGVHFEEILLPGPGGVEIGFVATREDSLKIAKALNVEPDSPFISMYASWLGNPWLTTIPDGVSIPKECYMNIHEALNATIKRLGPNAKSRTSTFLNVPTGEVAKASIDFYKKTYKLSTNVDEWVHVTYIPDLSSI